MIKDTVFQQIMKPMTKKLMAECVRRFQSDYDCETFTTDVHLQTMVYAHLAEIKSLRTLEVAINSHAIGMKHPIKRSTLSDANKRRPAACFFWLAEQLMGLLPRRLRKEIRQVVKLLDSSPVQLKGQGYEWTKDSITPRCQGLKLHLEYDLALRSPSQFAISAPNYNDITMANRWPITAHTIYVFDKGYCDFNWWWRIHQQQAFFVTRLKKNTAILMQKKHKTTSAAILEDGVFQLKNKRPRGGKINSYTAPLRRVSVAREGKTPLILVTNLHQVSAEHIAELYKARWEIALFFKWIKQNLKVKTFLGKSANAVKIQLVTALMAYLLVQIFKNISADQRRLQLVLTWVKYNLPRVYRNYPYRGPPSFQFSPLSLINHEVIL